MDTSLQRASEEYLKLLGFITDKPDGAMIFYDEVEKDTGVKMTIKNKSRLRRAIMRSKREYTTIPNKGYQLAEPDLAVGILSFRLMRIDNQVKRADKAQRIIQEQFLEALKPDEKKAVLFVGSIFGAIRLAAENGKRLYSKEDIKRLAETNVIVPD